MTPAESGGGPMIQTTTAHDTITGASIAQSAANLLVMS